MLTPLCSMLPLDYKLMRRCAKFMNNCLISDNDVVSYVARHGIFFSTNVLSYRLVMLKDAVRLLVFHYLTCMSLTSS